MLRVMTPAEVGDLVNARFAPAAAAETVELSRALGRVLAEDITADEYVPAFDRSAVDGYAVRAKDTFGCSDAIPAMLPVSAEVLMGQSADFELPRGTCCAVPTGGALPRGADCAVMVEYTEDYGDGTIGISKPAAPGQNTIYKGDDVYPGKAVLKRGHIVRPQDIGALAAIGRVSVPVAKKLRVAVISTGDELVPPHAAPAEGQIRDVNAPMLAAMLEEFGALPVPCGIVKDDEAALRTAVERALNECDAVLLSGGSSVGIKDAACRVIDSLGELLLHGIAVKPGKPTILGIAGKKPIAGLPGHPVAAYYVTREFILPLLARLMGREAQEYSVAATLGESVSANHGRAQFVGVKLEHTRDGLTATPVRSKSGLITALSSADGYFCIPRDCEGLPKGAAIQVRTTPR